MFDRCLSVTRLTRLARLICALLFSFAATSNSVRSQEVVKASKVDSSLVEPEQLQKAIHEGLEVLRKGVRNYPTHRDCFSCHHQALPLVAFSLQDRGSVEADLSQFFSHEQTQAIVEFTEASFAPKVAMMREGNGVGGKSLTVAYGLWTLDVGGMQANATTDAMVQYLIKTRAEDGAWEFQSHRPPAASSRVMTTAISVYGLRAFGEFGAEAVSVKSAFGRAAQFADQHQLDGSHEELIGALWLDHLLEQIGVGPAEAIAARLNQRVERLWDQQRADGGWAQIETLASDAYATGQALVMLTQVLGKQVHRDPRFERAVAYSLRSQCEDGSWHVVTRSKPVQVYFDNGDPHEKDQFISMMATSWSVAALANFQADGIGPLESVLVAKRAAAD